MLPISVCIIAKNESTNIKTCLEALKPYNFEIVVVDTGSTDNTIALARRYTNRVYSFPWCDDFSAARNYSIEKATNDWILILDCDEVVEKFDVDGVQKMMAEGETYLGQVVMMNEVCDSCGNITYNNALLERFFHRSHYRYQCAIHEQISALDPNLQILSKPIPVIVVHTGYNLSPEETKQKQLRNILLLEEAIKNKPLDPYLYFQLGQSTYLIGDIPRSLGAYEHALQLEPSSNVPYLKILYTNYASLLQQEKRYQEAIDILNDAGSLLDNYCDSSYLLGSIYYDMGHLPAAILQFIQATTSTTYYQMSAKTDLPNYMLGIIYQQLDNKPLALAFFKKCPHYKDASLHIKQLS